MLRSLNSVVGSSIHARDGEIGSLRNFLFDDETWTVRYVVVESGSWLSSRKVLISPAAVGQPDWEGKSLPVLLTKQQVRDSPPVETDLPVSRQHEIAMSQYYGWPAYWSMEPVPMLPVGGDPGVVVGDAHLRSAAEISGYKVLATDGELGEAEDFIINDDDWFIRYVAVSAGSWLSGHKLLVPTRWVSNVSWADREIVLSQTRENI